MSEEPRRLGDRYEVGELLGRGGMAEVHEGRDLRLGRRVAIKILRPDLARDPSFQARFRREAQSAAALNHPNIVAVYDNGEDVLENGTDSVTVPYIVMEHVDGMTLRQLLQSGRRLLPERALEMTAGVLAALDYSHRHGIVHRDIKPANVMLTRTGDVKVMDFGIARALADSGQTMTAAQAVMGTAQYLSPEQARGEIVDARSDLYSTGCLLYELLTGRPPFMGDSPVSIAYQHVSEPPVPPSQIDPAVPPSVDAIVLTSLAKDPGARYQTAAEMRADVERAIAGMPVTASMAAVAAAPADATTRLAPVGAAVAPADPASGGRGPWAWVLLTVAVIAIVGGAAFLAFRLFGTTAVPKVTVPSLTGLTAAQAQSTLTGAGLSLGSQTPQTSEKPKDTIIAQQPGAGIEVDKGSSVDVTVSAGKEQATVPRLVGLASPDDARNVLAQSKLQLGTVTPKDSDQPEGYVLDQQPKAQTQVDVGSLVNITVSSGKVAVPDVKGKSEAQARSDLTNAGFEVNVVNQEDGTVDPGTVLAQSPQPGTKAKKGSQVTITVATSPPPPTTSATTSSPPPPTTSPPPLLPRERHMSTDTGPTDRQDLDARMAALVGSDDADAWNALGCDLHDAGRLPEAEACFRRSVSLGDDQVAFNLGNVLHDLGRHDEAVAAYRAAVAAGEIDAHQNLGLLLAELGDVAGAREQFEAGVAAGDPAGHLGLAMLLRDADDVAGAEAALRAALAAGHPAARLALAELLAESQRDDEAEALLRTAADTDAEARIDLALLLARTRRADEARVLLEAAVVKGQREALLPLGNLLVDEFDDVAGAEALYRRAADAGDRFAHHNLAILLWDSGRVAEAEAEFERGAAAGDEIAAGALAELRAARS